MKQITNLCKMIVEHIFNNQIVSNTTAIYAECITFAEKFGETAHARQMKTNFFALA